MSAGDWCSCSKDACCYVCDPTPTLYEETTKEEMHELFLEASFDAERRKRRALAWKRLARRLHRELFAAYHGMMQARSAESDEREERLRLESYLRLILDDARESKRLVHKFEIDTIMGQVERLAERALSES